MPDVLFPMTTTLSSQSAIKDIIKPDFHQLNLPAETFIKNELRFKLDKGKSPYVKQTFALTDHNF
jgi:hypothetical protein